LTIRYLLDANVLSEPIKSQPDSHVVQAIADHDGELATCSIVWHELCYGVARLAPSTKRRAIETYLEEAVRVALPILPYDEPAAAWHAQERARLGRRGRPPSAADHREHARLSAIRRIADRRLVTLIVTPFAVSAGALDELRSSCSPGLAPKARPAPAPRPSVLPRSEAESHAGPLFWRYFRCDRAVTCRLIAGLAKQIDCSRARILFQCAPFWLHLLGRSSLVLSAVSLVSRWPLLQLPTVLDRASRNRAESPRMMRAPAAGTFGTEASSKAEAVWKTNAHP
jgi:tRNA(fMet)-specific endonuclease VapC